MNQALDGRRILLTGASRGIGRAAAELLLRHGARVLGVAKNEQRLATAQQELTAAGFAHFSSMALDLTHPQAGMQLKQRLLSDWGGVDLVILNAGVQYNAGDIMSEPDGMLEASLNENLLAPYRLAQALLPLLMQSHEPRLINVSSGAGTLTALSEENIASYRLSKWALNGLTLLQARQFKGQVHVSAFDPGWIKTDLGGPLAPGTPQEAADGLLKTLLVPWVDSGKFYKDGQVIPW